MSFRFLICAVFFLRVLSVQAQQANWLQEPQDSNQETLQRKFNLLATNLILWWPENTEFIIYEEELNAFNRLHNFDWRWNLSFGQIQLENPADSAVSASGGMALKINEGRVVEWKPSLKVGWIDITDAATLSGSVNISKAVFSGLGLLAGDETKDELLSLTDRVSQNIRELRVQNGYVIIRLGKKVCFTNTTSNIRTGPDVAFRVKEVVQDQQIVEILDQEKGWLYISYSKSDFFRRGWIHVNLVERIFLGGSQLTTRELCPFYMEPAEKADIISAFPDGTHIYALVNNDSQWIKVTTDFDNYGWVRSDCVF